MPTRKEILNAALKALIAGSQTSACIKIPAVFIAELAGLSKEKLNALDSAYPERLEELLAQSELSTANAALAAAGTEQIKALVGNLSRLTTEQLNALTELTKEQYNNILSELRNNNSVTIDIKGDTQEIKSDVKKVLEIAKGSKPRLASGPIVNLPYPSIGNLFKGREKDLEKLLGQADGAAATAITQQMTMTGLGGIGKTRLAVEFAWEGLRQGVFRDVFFVGCGQDGKTVTSKNDAAEAERQEQTELERLRAAVSMLGAENLLAIDGYAEKKTDSIFAEVLRELQQRDKWLLIFDNADDTEMREAVLRMLPLLSCGRVLITSRLSDWGNGVGKIKLEKLGIAPARDYLLELTASRRVKSDNDKESAEKLGGQDYLDGLPVALEQAGKYICRMKISFARYLEEYRENQNDVLAWEKTNKLPEDYPRPVLTTWQMTEQKLTEAERAMLFMAAFMAPKNIPIELFEKNPQLIEAAITLVSGGAQSGGTTGASSSIREALAGLADWSMAEFEGGSFSVHRMVQETTRLRMEREVQEGVCQILLSLLADTDPGVSPSDIRSWGYWKVMEAHIAAAVGYADGLAITKPTSVLMNNLGLYFDAQARFAQAEPLMKRALAIDEASFGKEHPRVAIRLNNLAGLYQETGRYREAEPLMERVLAIDEAAYGKDHPEVATDLNNLAQLYKATNRLGEAEPLMKRALAIDEAAYGKDHPMVAIRLNNLAALYQATNRLGEAEPLMKRVVEIFEKSLGNDHPNVATAISNLAGLYQDTNRLGEAEPLMKRALAIDEASYGKDHPEVATDLNNLAALYKATGRLGEAEPLMKRALAIWKKSLGENHPEVAMALNNLAQLYQATGRTREAEPLMKRHLEIFLEFTRKTGHRHPHLKAAVNNYAGLLMEMGKSEEEIDARLKGMEGIDD